MSLRARPQSGARNRRLSASATTTGAATINSIGNLGGFVGPAMIGWIKEQTGSFNGGLYFVAGLLVLSAVLTSSWPARTARAPIALPVAQQ